LTGEHRQQLVTRVKLLSKLQQRKATEITVDTGDSFSWLSGNIN